MSHIVVQWKYGAHTWEKNAHQYYSEDKTEQKYLHFGADIVSLYTVYGQKVRRTIDNL